MVDNLSNLQEFLSGFINKPVIVKQDGFVKCQFSLENFAFSIDYEISKFFDNNGSNYLTINLNQVYSFEAFDDMLKFYLDNDTIAMLYLKN